MQITSLPKAVVASDIAPERLAHNSALTEQQKIGEASRQFEAILLRQILSATQKTVINSKFADNSTAAEIYRDMITTQLSDSISKSGSFGLAQSFEHQLSRPAATCALPGAATAVHQFNHSKDPSELVTPGVRPLGHGKDLHHAHE